MFGYSIKFLSSFAFSNQFDHILRLHAVMHGCIYGLLPLECCQFAPFRVSSVMLCRASVSSKPITACAVARQRKPGDAAAAKERAAAGLRAMGLPLPTKRGITAAPDLVLGPSVSSSKHAQSDQDQEMDTTTPGSRDGPDRTAVSAMPLAQQRGMPDAHQLSHRFPAAVPAQNTPRPAPAQAGPTPIGAVAYPSVRLSSGNDLAAEAQAAVVVYEQQREHLVLKQAAQHKQVRISIVGSIMAKDFWRRRN